MRPLRDMDTIQIEVTNACVRTCSNCTRLCGHHLEPFFMTYTDFTRAVDSLAEYPGLVGVMGGEPLLHPEFERFCNYLHGKRHPDRCGLWSTFPNGKQHYAKLITETFWNVLLNDHSSPGIAHMPVLVAAKECMPEEEYWYAAHRCFFQNVWSASITPRGAYFCEVAAALDIILETEKGWPVQPGWWKKSPNHFITQMEIFCPNCGGALHCTSRMDVEGIDDISPGWAEELRQRGSPKVKAGRYRIYDGKAFTNVEPINTFRCDLVYFEKIAAKYGLTLVRQKSGYLRPVL